MATPTKFGTEFLVNTTTPGGQVRVEVEAFADGRFIAAFADFGTGDVRARLFHADGSGAANDFQLASTTAGNQSVPTITVLADGRIVAAWRDSNTNAGDIRARLYDTNGNPIVANGSTDDFLVNTTVAGSQDEPDVVGFSDGRFIVAWEDAGTTDVRARLFNSDGSPAAADFALNTTTAGIQLFPQIAVLANGRFVAIWQDNGSTDIRGRMFDAAGTPVTVNGSTNDFLVSTTTAGSQTFPDVVALTGGGFVATWETSTNSRDVHAQVFNADGTALGGEIQVNTETADQQSVPRVAALPDGRFVIVWQDQHVTTDDPVPNAIRAQLFEANGTPSGSDLPVNTTTAAAQNTPTLVALADGRFVVAWDDQSLSPDDSSGDALRAQIFEPREAGVTLTGTAANDDFIGTRFNDTFNGGPGNDTLDGGAGDDTAIFSGNLASYTLQDLTLQGLGDRIAVSGPDGTDTLTSIEHARFADSNALFDTLFYLTHNPDVFHAGVNSPGHFNTFGFHEGRDPDAFFDTSGYLAVNRDVAAAGINPLTHFDRFGWKEGRDPGPNFDTRLYLLHNPDVAAAGADPLEHFLAHGIAEGRQAFQAIGTAVNGFDAEFYLFHNPDVAAAGVNPLQHFNTSGFHEGRNPNAYFDTAGYLSHYADVAAAGVNPLQHYEQFGWKEGRDPSAGFDTLGYLAANPDVAAAHVNPLDHFLNFGIYEGRQAVNDGLFH